MLRSVRVLRNIVTNYLRFAVTGLLGFVVTPFMVRLLGDGNYGLWVTIFSVTGYFGLFDQGIRPSLVRYVSRDYTRGDREGLSRTISSALALYTLAGILVMVATAIVAARFPDWFHIAPSQTPMARWTLLLAGASLAIGFPFGVLGATLSGLQRYDIANTIGIVVSLVRGVLFVVVLHAGGGLVGLALTSLIMNLIGHLWSWVAVRRLLGGALRVGWHYITRSHLRLVGSYSGFAFVGALATSIAFQTDALVITGFMGAAAVTPFALAAGLVENVRSLVHSATWVLSPTASELDTRGESGKLHAMMILGAKYSVLVSWPVLIGLIIFGQNVLVTWVGPKYADAARLITILAVPTLLTLPQSTAGSMLYGVSRHKGVVVLSLVNALLNLGLSLWWVRSYGLVGVAMGTAVPLALVNGVGMILFACSALRLPLRRYLWEGLGQPGLITAVFAVPALLLQWRFHPTAWISLFGTCAACWALFAACAWRWGFDPVERARWGRMLTGLFRTGTPVASGEVTR